ncbi:MAG: hypothetical protein U5N85_10335 [Arcicella sp.]|nr:hypothetical protein [Arcicella sp.]
MNILYLVFGNEQRNHSQAYFSICSFLGQMEASDRIFVMTDNPNFYDRLSKRINTLTINLELLNTWQGEYKFFWRAKIKAIEHICHLHPEQQTLYLDTDTFLFSTLNQLKDQLKNPVMHLNECELSQLKSKTDKMMWQQVGNRTFGGININSNHCMWNAGVVGIPANKGQMVTELALNVCDDMLKKNITRRLIEQFSLSVALSEKGNLQAAEPFIGHYWSNKDEWNEAIQKFMLKSFLKGNSVQDDIEAISTFDFSKIAIQKRIPNTQLRLKKIISKWFPSEDQAFVASKLHNPIT